MLLRWANAADRRLVCPLGFPLKPGELAETEENPGQPAEILHLEKRSDQVAYGNTIHWTDSRTVIGVFLAGPALS